MAPGVGRELEGVGGQVRQGRGGREAHLDDVLDAEPALGGRAEHHVLGLDPAHRGGELPGEELDEQETAELGAPGRPAVPVLQGCADLLGGHDVEDRGGELAGQREGAGHEVGNVAVLEAVDVEVGRDELLEALAELGDAGAQDLGVERQVDAGHEHEGVLAAAGLGLGARVGGQGVQSLDGPGDGVLDAGQVVVDDLQELAGGLGDGGDVGLDVLGADAGVVGAQGAHPVVGGACLVTRDEGMHRGAALEDDGDRRLHRHDPPVGGQCRVLAQGVAGEDGALDERAGLGQPRGGGHGDGGQGDLRELGEVEQALGVAVGHAAGGHLRGVVAHEGDDGEAELGAGVGVGPLPDLAGGLGGGALVQAHAGGLDALAGVDVGGGLGQGDGGAARDDLAVDTAHDLQDVATATHELGALDADLDVVVQLHGAGHDVGPAGELVVGAIGGGGGGDLLGGRRQPHSVDERGVHAGDLRGVVAGVDGVEVAGDAGEGRHVRGRGDGDAAQEAAGGGGGLAAGAAGGLGRRGNGGAGGAPADGEALAQEGDELAVVLAAGAVGHLQAHVDDAAGAGLLQGGDPAVDLHAGARAGPGLELVERAAQVDGVVEVDGAEQALDERHAVLDDAAQGRVDDGPGGAEEGVRHEGHGGQVGGQRVGGHGGVVVAEGVRQGELGVDGAEGLVDRPAQGVGGAVGGGAHLGQLLDEVAGDGGGADAGGDPQEVVHGLADAAGVHQGGGAVGGAGQAQRDDEAAHGVDVVPAGRGVPVRVEVDVEVVGVGRDVGAGGDGVGLVGQDPGGVDGQVAVPQDVGGGAHEGERVGHGGAVGAPGGADAARGVAGLLAGGLEGLDGGGLEAAEELADRLVDGGDAGHRDGAGDDTDLVGGVARVLGLPQGVGAPPAQDVGVDDGHEGDRLGVLAAQVDEPGGVDGLDARGGGARVGPREGGQRGVGVDDVVVVGEESGDGAPVGGRQAGLDAVEEVEEAVVPALVGPVGLDSGAPLVRGDAQLGVAGGPLEVGHGLDIAEVGLGGARERLDHLVAALAHGGLVAGELLDEAGGAGRRVVDLVEVGAQVGQAGGHAAARGAGGDPAALVGRVDPGGVDEQLLDVVVGLGLQAGHGGGADHDAVDGGGGGAVGQGPAAGEVVGGALGGADAAAHAQHDVVDGADGVVGGQEHRVQVLPRVVAPGVPVLDLHDDGGVLVGAGDGQDLADLVDGAGLEGDVGEALGAEARQQGGGLLQLGDARGDGDAVHGGAAGAGLGQEPLGAQVEVPQVAVHEHGVERGGAAGVEEPGEPGDVLGEHGAGGLPAAGELGPVAGVGGRRDDGRVHGGGGHPGEHDGAAAGQAGEGGVDGDAPVGQAGQARGEAGAVDGAGGLGALAVELVEGGGGAGRDDGGARAGQDGVGEAGEHRAGAEVDDGAGRGAVGAGAGQGAGDLGGPVDDVDEDGDGELAGGGLVEAAAAGPVDDVLDGGGQQRGVEGHGGRQELGDGGEHRPAQAALLAGLGAAGGGCLQRGDDLLEVGGAPGEDVGLAAVDDAHRDALGGGDAGEHGVEDLAGHAAHGQHGGGLPHGAQVEAAGGAGGGGADEPGDGVDLDGAGLALVGRALEGAEQRDAEDALGVPDGARGAGGGLAGGVEAAGAHGVQGGVLGQEDAGHGDVGGVSGGGSPARRHGDNRRGGIVEEAGPARGDGEQLGGHRRETLRDGDVDGGQAGRELAVEPDELGQDGAPGGGLAAEGEDVGLAGAQSGGGGAGGRRGGDGLAHVFLVVAGMGGRDGLRGLAGAGAAECGARAGVAGRHRGTLSCFLWPTARAPRLARRAARDSAMTPRVSSGAMTASISPMATALSGLMTVSV